MTPKRGSFIILGSLLLTGLPFFFLGGPGYQSGRSFQGAWDLGHILFFALLGTLLLGLCKRRTAVVGIGRTFALVFILVFAVGLVVELLQMQSGGRTPDPADLVRNQLGCLLAFALFAPPDWRWTRLLRLGVAVLLVLALWPLSRALIDETLAARQFPVLADFETPFETRRWVHPSQLHTQSGTVRHGERAARVQLTTARYSGVSLFHFPGDWRGYRWLRFKTRATGSTATSSMTASTSSSGCSRAGTTWSWIWTGYGPRPGAASWTWGGSRGSACLSSSNHGR
jgi:VanZ family protein